MDKENLSRDSEELTPELRELKNAFSQELENVPAYVESLVTDLEEPMGLEVLLEAVGEEGIFVDMEPERQRVLLEAIQGKLGVNFSAEPVRKYSWEGPVGMPGEGTADIGVFATNQENVAVHRIEYADGKVSYAFGPLQLP